jgi:Sulfotransferase domain
VKKTKPTSFWGIALDVGFLRQLPVVSSISGLFDEREVDVYVVSFPKCGRTWLRVQLGRLFQQHFGLDVTDLVELEDMAGLRQGIPHLRFTHPGRPQEKKDKEISALTVDFFRFRKVILLIRDPRDVVVSMYHERTKRGMQPVFTGSLDQFIREPIGSFDTLLKFYDVWLRRRKPGKRTLVVRYEDMHLRPENELRRIVDFIGLKDIGDAEISDAIKFTMFDRMREMERNNTMNNWRLAPGDPADSNSFKTRRGKVGGYRDELTDEEIEWLEGRMAAWPHLPYSAAVSMQKADRFD